MTVISRVMVAISRNWGVILMHLSAITVIPAVIRRDMVTVSRKRGVILVNLGAIPAIRAAIPGVMVAIPRDIVAAIPMVAVGLVPVVFPFVFLPPMLLPPVFVAIPSMIRIAIGMMEILMGRRAAGRWPLSGREGSRNNERA